MRLKKLYLHGYKTFANKTEIIFDGGITAVVGPNGSGKSNVADSIRWVLGEQAYTVMRGKKTEDMIFNGSSERSRMGMAEVVITLDNADNFLPIDFDEVVIGRRAYRSGENEYYLNGNRVRLRDVHELLDRSGLGRRTHTVIGQGMIDQALALKPEDRRELFEEAAGITIYRTKRRQTLDRLAKTQDNLTRVRDIITEIAPRLRQLERQAERARQHEDISGELRQRLLVWYGYNWHLALSRLVDSRTAVEHWQRVATHTGEGIAAYNAETAGLRERQTELRSQLAEWRRQLAEHEEERTTVAREQAVGQERLRAMQASRERLQQELELLVGRRESEFARVDEAVEVFKAINAQREAHQTQHGQAQAELNAQEIERQRTEQELAGTRRKHFDFSTRLADRENRIEQAKERRKAVQAERAVDAEAAEAAAAEASRWQGEFDAISAELGGIGRQIQNLGEQHRQTEARQQKLIGQRTEVESQRVELDAQLRTMQARFDLLDRLRSEGEGLFAGVKRVIQASQQGELEGVLGPIATLINVPDELEQAIEVALGARIQDVVMRRWRHAENAINYLKQQRGGRATFLPLDNLRPQQRRPAPPEQGVLGWAADLIEFEAEISPAVELLLGQTLVVTDLAAARAVSAGRDRPRIVTLEGDFVHPGGSVSGGSNEQRQRGGMLAREREWRTLPGQIESAEQQIHEQRQQLEHLGQAIAAVDEQLTALVKQAGALGEAERERTAMLNRHQNQIDRARQTELWRRERMNKLALELEELGRRLAGLRQETGEFSTQQNSLSNRIAALDEKLATLSTAGLMQALAHAQARLEAVEERRRSQQALVDNHRQTLRQTDVEIQERQRRSQSLKSESEALQARIEQLQAAHMQTDEAYQGLIEQVEPAQAELDELDAGWVEHDRRGETLRQRLHQEEMHLSQTQLAQQRAEDHLTYLRTQIEHDFGLVALEGEAGMPSQEPLPFDQIVTALPRLEELPLEAEMEIRRLKGLLNRLGAINPQAKAEFESTQERFQFLNQQADDLEASSAQLIQVISELDQLIDQEFRRTFTAVSKMFVRYFTRLFGGGTAKLVLTDTEDITTTGVDIIARPPGKRPTNLSMLSGGERALTAVALIFAVLSVSPTPFCVLDEVDAALDESNVVRVREVLLELAAEAQFIVITHNRGTVEVANTIYGISMGTDSVSQSLSLRLENGKLRESEEVVGI